MIRVRRSAAVPEALRTKGRSLRDDAVAAHGRGETSFSFDASVYGDEEVKSSLRSSQHGKCCFCESKVEHVSSGDIEHFRPKAGFRADEGGPLVKPGYFWLAYEWSNLLYACEVCNRRSKRNHFPLEDEARRASHPSHSLADERPLFIDPATEDPEAHVSFREEYPFAFKGSPRGEATWRGLGLDRPALVERRREALKTFRVLQKALRVARARRTMKALVPELEREINQRLDERHEFAGMFRAAVTPRRGGRGGGRA